MRRPAVLILPCIAACAESAFDAEAPSAAGCPDNSASMSLTVAPDPLTRDAAVELVIEWALYQRLDAGAVALLTASGDFVVEVAVPLLAAAGTAEPTYTGAITNPFGSAAPPGVVTVLAQARPVSGCSLQPSAATSLSLE